MNKIACIIPARYASTRLPGKPLRLINDKPLILWAYDNAVKSGVFDSVHVATDDSRIFDTVNNHGGSAIMTSADHQSGTDRIYEAAQAINCTHVVNLQGDEPMIPHTVLQNFTKKLEKLDHRSLLTYITNATIEEINNPNSVKVVVSNSMKALYFSRSTIPFSRGDTNPAYYKHCGIYGFTMESLKTFCTLERTPLELSESLEQLRALENDMVIQCLFDEFRNIGIDTEEDLQKFITLVSS